MKYFSFLAFFLLTFASCKKNKSDVKAKTFYVLTNQSVSGKNTVKYFFNGSSVTIGDGSTVSIYGHDMEVQGTDVYVLAQKLVISTGVYSNVIYKNGAEIQSVPYDNTFYPNCLAVNGSDLYLSGTGLVPGSSNPQVKLWKNGTLNTITTNAQFSCRVWDMALNGTDVYLAGYEVDQNTGYQSAKYWKNTTGVTVTAGTAATDAEIHRITFSGSDVYCSGMINDKATVWKNGNATELTNDPSYCYGIAVSGNDVYAAGAVSNGGVYKAVYWKNGQLNRLDLTNSSSTNHSSVFGIAVDGSDIYVIGDVYQDGNTSSRAVYWKNGVETLLVNNPGFFASGYRFALK